MKFARYLAHGDISYGIVDNNIVKEITNNPFSSFEITDHSHPLSEVKILAPCLPGKILAVGLNYRSHLGDRPGLTEPLIFLKTPTSLIGTGESIVLPKNFQGRVDEEGEVVAVIKDRCKNVPKEEALQQVDAAVDEAAGFVGRLYALSNKLSARRFSEGRHQLDEASFSGFNMNIAHQAHVKLDVAGLEVSEHGEAVIASTKVIDCQGESTLHENIQRLFPKRNVL